MKTNFAVWEKFVKSSGSIVKKIRDGFEVDGDVILINCGLTHIPEGLVAVSGTLDISLNPIESFECNIERVGRLICIGTKPISLKSLKFSINHNKGDKISESDISIEKCDIDEIKNAMFVGLKEKLPELEGIFE
jgi:hypothetical protein